MGLTGLFFGSFNPIHNGHLAIAKYLLDKKYCEKVWFIVSPQNPWKERQVLLDEQKRLQIVQAAIRSDERMRVFDIEFHMPRPSYTYQTLQALTPKYPEERFALIIGGDNLRDFHKWLHYQDIQRQYPILVYPRPNVEIPENNLINITLVDAPMSEVSSTMIRQKIMESKDISNDVPTTSLALILKYYSVL